MLSATQLPLPTPSGPHCSPPTFSYPLEPHETFEPTRIFFAPQSSFLLYPRFTSLHFILPPFLCFPFVFAIFRIFEFHFISFLSLCLLFERSLFCLYFFFCDHFAFTSSTSRFAFRFSLLFTVPHVSHPTFHTHTPNSPSHVPTSHITDGSSHNTYMIDRSPYFFLLSTLCLPSFLPSFPNGLNRLPFDRHV